MSVVMGHWQKKVRLPNFVYLGGPLAKGGSSARKSRFICQFLCSGGPLAEEGSSVKFCVPRGVHWPKEVHLPEKVGSSAKFCVPGGGPSAEEGLSARFEFPDV